MLALWDADEEKLGWDKGVEEVSVLFPFFCHTRDKYAGLQLS